MVGGRTWRSLELSIALLLISTLGASLSAEGKPLLPAEEEALLAVREEGGGAVTWRGGADCSQWEGVTCADSGHVATINLQTLQLSDKTLQELRKKLPFLEAGSQKTPSKPINLLIDSSKPPEKEPILPRKLGSSLSSTSTNFRAHSRVLTASALNLSIWEERKRVTNIVGVMSVPSRGSFSPSASLISRRFKQASAKPTLGLARIVDLFDCNVGFPASQVVQSFEDFGLASGIVALRKWDSISMGWVLLCSGALLAPQLVLTAAHCLYNTDANSWLVSESDPIMVYSRYNGATDTVYSTSLATDPMLFTEYLRKSTWEDSLFDSCDFATLRLKDSLPGSTYSWTDPAQGGSGRINYGYPAETQDGNSLIFDQGDVKLTMGCDGLSRSVFCEKVSIEGGMSGGPMFSNYYDGLIVGVASGSTLDGCPAYYGGVTGKFKLATLVKRHKCEVLETKTSLGIIKTAKC